MASTKVAPMVSQTVESMGSYWAVEKAERRVGGKEQKTVFSTAAVMVACLVGC